MFYDCKNYEKSDLHCPFPLLHSNETAHVIHNYSMLAWIGHHILYLAEVFLAVILEVFWIYVYLVLVYSVRPRIFCWFLYKLLNFHCRLMFLYVIKRLDWNKRWSYTVFKRTEKKNITYSVSLHTNLSHT